MDCHLVVVRELFPQRAVHLANCNHLLSFFIAGVSMRNFYFIGGCLFRYSIWLGLLLSATRGTCPVGFSPGHMFRRFSPFFQSPFPSAAAFSRPHIFLHMIHFSVFLISAHFPSATRFWKLSIVSASARMFSIGVVPSSF